MHRHESNSAQGQMLLCAGASFELTKKCDCKHHSGANLLPPTPIQPQYLGDRHAYHDYIKCNVNTGVGPSLEVDIVAATTVFPVPSNPSVADWPALKHGGDEERKC